MPRPSGWSILAKEALELGALALAVRFMALRADTKVAPTPVLSTDPPPTGLPPAPPAPAIKLAPFDFVKETGDAHTRYYRAHDTEGVMYAGFYDDGRVRVADTARSFAGMVQNGHAHLLQIDTEDWCEMFVRTTPAGALQLELRDGPYDGRILTCEPCGVRGEA